MKRQGCRVRTDLNAWALARAQSPNEVTLFGIYILDQSEERLAALAEARGLPRDPDADPDLKLCLIFDLSGIAISNVDLSVAKRIIYMLTHFYPERMGDCLLLNAPAQPRPARRGAMCQRFVLFQSALCLGTVWPRRNRQACCSAFHLLPLTVLSRCGRPSSPPHGW